MEELKGDEVSTEAGWTEVPEGMRAFVASNGLPADAYQLRGLFRYVRLNPRLWSSARTTSPLETAAMLQRELGGEGALEAEAVEWLPGFFRLPHSASISDSDLYGHPSLLCATSSELMCRAQLEHAGTRRAR